MSGTGPRRARDPGQAAVEAGDERERVARLILGRSSAIEALRLEVLALASTPLRSVLVLGETGVGKDLVPRALHACSRYLGGPLVVFNCPAIPADHLESELFGTARGAYPGSVDRPGAAERADGGLLSLDEIGAMPLIHQAKILRLLESGEGSRLGAGRSYRVEAAVAAATNEDLSLAVRGGRFREDLYYRLVQDAVLWVPPLRERLEDVPVLAETFLAEVGAGLLLSGPALEVLAGYSWPGNVRELRAVVRTAARSARGGTVSAEAVHGALQVVPLRARRSSAGSPASPGQGGGAASFVGATDHVRRQLLVDALDLAGGNQTQAGVLLGMHALERQAPPVSLDLRSRKLAQRKFAYWYRKLVSSSREVR